MTLYFSAGWFIIRVLGVTRGLAAVCVLLASRCTRGH